MFGARGCLDAMSLATQKSGGNESLLNYSIAASLVEIMCPSLSHCKVMDDQGGLRTAWETRQNVTCIVNTLFGSRYKRRIQEKREGVTGREGKGGERLPWYLFRM